MPQGFRSDDDTVTVIHTTGEWDLGWNHGGADVSIRGLAARTPTALQVGFMTSTLSAAGLSETAVARFLLHNIRPRISDVVAPFIDFRARGLIKPEWESIKIAAAGHGTAQDFVFEGRITLIAGSARDMGTPVQVMRSRSPGPGVTLSIGSFPWES